jgi:hypothetical protein
MARSNCASRKFARARHAPRRSTSTRQTP